MKYLFLLFPTLLLFSCSDENTQVKTSINIEIPKTVSFFNEGLKPGLEMTKIKSFDKNAVLNKEESKDMGFYVVTSEVEFKGGYVNTTYYSGFKDKGLAVVRASYGFDKDFTAEQLASYIEAIDKNLPNVKHKEIGGKHFWDTKDSCSFDIILSDNYGFEIEISYLNNKSNIMPLKPYRQSLYNPNSEEVLKSEVLKFITNYKNGLAPGIAMDKVKSYDKTATPGIIGALAEEAKEDREGVYTGIYFNQNVNTTYFYESTYQTKTLSKYDVTFSTVEDSDVVEDTDPKFKIKLQSYIDLITKELPHIEFEKVDNEYGGEYSWFTETGEIELYNINEYGFTLSVK